MNEPQSDPVLWDRITGWISGAYEAIHATWLRGEAWFAATEARLLTACLLLAVGLFILMPGRRRVKFRVIGGILGGLGVAVLLSLVPGSALSVTSVSFALICSMTIVSAVGTVTSKSPIYCAIWFALTLFGVGSLLLINGAQFLGIATVAVYAGAIVVTLLFVLMLAQPEGHTHYDRISWGRTAQWLACFAGAVSACLLIWAFLQTPLPAHTLDEAANPTLNSAHVASLGATLFSRYLIAVELGGLLLFAALVGAVSMAAVPASEMQRQLDRALRNSPATGGIPHE